MKAKEIQRPFIFNNYVIVRKGESSAEKREQFNRRLLSGQTMVAKEGTLYVPD